MGIFQSRPEELDEWAGLPAEPWRPPEESLLPEAGDIGLLGASTVSLVVPLDDPGAGAGDATTEDSAE